MLKRKVNKKDVNYFVSILVPCYNEEVYIKECLSSIVKQDYKNYEVIIINDGSTDNTSNIIKSFISKNKLKTFKLIDIKTRIGKAKALNEGFKRAKGDIIAFLDSDSILKKDSLKNILQYFDNDISGVSGNVQIIKKKNNLINNIQEVEYALSQEVFRCSQGVTGNCMIIPGVFCVYKKDYLNRVEEGTISEDFDTSSKILSKGLKTVFAEDAVVNTAIPQNLVDLISQRLRWQQGGFEVVSKYLLNFPRLSTKLWYFWFIFSVIQGCLLRTFVLTLIPLYILYSPFVLLILLAHLIYTSLLYGILLIFHNVKYKRNNLAIYLSRLPILTIYYFFIFTFATYLGILCALKRNKEWLNIKR